MGPRIMGESHQPGSTKVDLTYLLTSLRLMQQWPHYHEIWSSITPTEMDNALFPSYFRSRKSWTQSISTGLQQLKEKMPSKTKKLKLEASSIPESEESEDFNPNDISEKSRDAVFLNLKQVTDAAIRPTEKQMRILIERNKQKIESDSVKKQCSRPKCQFPTRCFWTKLREQEATESLYIANECLTIQETPLRIARQQEKGISQDNIPLKDPSLPATGLKMTDLDNQVKTATNQPTNQPSIHPSNQTKPT